MNNKSDYVTKGTLDILGIKEPHSESVKVETQKTRPASSFTKGPSWALHLLHQFSDNSIALPSSVHKNFRRIIVVEETPLIQEAYAVATETGLTPRQLVKQRETLFRFFDAWVRCESSRGRYSCTPEHDIRCPKDSTHACECGWDELCVLENSVMAFRKVTSV